MEKHFQEGRYYKNDNISEIDLQIQCNALSKSQLLVGFFFFKNIIYNLILKLQTNLEKRTKVKDSLPTSKTYHNSYCN